MATRLLVGVILWVSLGLGGCEERGACREICVRVARCKAEARVGEPLLGERAPAPDKRCMKRCETKAKNFDICEAKQRTCKDLKHCLGQ
ncbi:MAG: hypothetical protein JRI68_20285 [Deltaproteobacteria bacterium]|nr:hypothetical protein [Deltaproteobacteria bacterium]